MTERGRSVSQHYRSCATQKRPGSYRKPAVREVDYESQDQAAAGGPPAFAQQRWLLKVTSSIALKT